MELIDVTLITPDKHKLGQRPPIEIAKARIRLVIESVFSNLKRQMRLDHHLAKTARRTRRNASPNGCSRSPSACYINILTGRPPRALAAYDGR